ncbi:MAG: hypothetical protein K2M95_02360 [Clostridiales bacterium]|nr:hypothetical protein [Clostridiales bacterium]
MRKHVHTAAIILLLLCFLSVTVSVFLFASTVRFSGFATAQASPCIYVTNGSGALVPVAAKANMRIGEWVVLVAVVTVGALAFLALFLFMLVFPLINRIAGTHIPCFDLFSSEEKPQEEAASKKSDKSKRTTKTADGSAGYADDRYVKTVRIDTLYHPEEAQEKEITASAIDKAVRQASQGSSGKKKK